MAKLDVSSPEGLARAMFGPGAIIADLADYSIEGIAAALARDQSVGKLIGMMNDTPTFTVANEVQDLFEDVVGVSASIKGSKALQRTDVTLEASMIELDPENLDVIHPTLESYDWLSDQHGKATIGVGSAAFGVTAREGGVAGNTISVALSAPSGASTTVSVTGEAITVTPKTGATVKEVVAAINTHLQASTLVRAGYKKDTNINAAVATVTSTTLTGGAAGTRIGTRQRPRGYFLNKDYHDLTLVLESSDVRIAKVITLYNCLATEDFELSLEDQNVSGATTTWTGHSDASTYDVTSGSYLPPYEIFSLDPVAVV